MRMYVISDNTDTLTGLRLAGVDGSVVHTHEELGAELEKVMGDRDIGILLIMENLSAKFPEIIDKIKLTRSLPLVVEIPDRHGTAKSPDFISNYVREAVGVKL